MASWFSNETAIHECSNPKCLGKLYQLTSKFADCGTWSSWSNILWVNWSCHMNTLIRLPCKRPPLMHGSGKFLNTIFSVHYMTHWLSVPSKGQNQFCQRNIQHAEGSSPADRKKEQSPNDTCLPWTWEHVRSMSKDQRNACNSVG
jgi:hypothetical protein